jgi:hypothetical protein
MFRTRVVGLLFTALFANCVPFPLFGQTDLKILKEVKLPVPLFRGMWWSASVQSRWYFSIQVTPNKELLAFEPDRNGKWPLVKVAQWWSKDPQSTILTIPGWSAKDDESLERLGTDLKITPDGKYAVAFASAEWNKSSSAAIREADTIVTVIDLSRWQIVKTAHTSALHLGRFSGCWISNSGLMALTVDAVDSSQTTRSYVVVSIPALSPSTQCRTQESNLPSSNVKKNEPDRRKRDDEACADLLATSGATSVEELEALTTTGRSPVPETLKGVEGMPYASRFMSKAGSWYGLDSVNSVLSFWGPDGESIRKRKSPHLLCEGQPVQGPAWICDCDIVGLSDNGHNLLAHCIAKHDNFLGSQVWLKQWLSVFQSDDLSELALIRLASRSEETKAVIVSMDGITYVLAVSVGDTLRVYKVPGPPGF